MAGTTGYVGALIQAENPNNKKQIITTEAFIESNKLKIDLFIAFSRKQKIMSPLHDKIFSVSPSSFEELALEIFRFQFYQTEVYQDFCIGIKKTPSTVLQISDIPFLPISFFKTHTVLANSKVAERIFESSGTTGINSSKHYVANISLYEASFLRTFNLFYGDPREYVVLALLPSYAERKNSSLIYMAEKLVELSGKNASGFFLHEHENLYDLLDVLKSGNRKTILLGVSFALLDFVEKYKLDFPGLVVMETGGMKGRREEITREELHTQLRVGFDVKHIHSEYGMTEMLSQAYSKSEGIFYSPPWLRILTRDIYEPTRIQEKNKTGGINVIDLANLYSCSFIATDDLGMVRDDDSFEILGRIDNAEMRGCNLLTI